MLVVVILAILTTIALPKFGNVIRTANEGSTKAKLGAIRSAITIYYVDSDGQYPSDLVQFQQPGNKYVSGIPAAYTFTHGNSTNINYSVTKDTTADSGDWGYVTAGIDKGTIWVQCTHTDVKGTTWTNY